MTDTSNLKIQEKKELTSKEEKTIPGKYYIPYTDIYETDNALTVVMEIPGIKKDAIDIQLNKDELTVSAEINLESYKRFQPVYTEYNVGHFSRSFALSNKVDRDKIEANVTNGILSLKLPKAEELKPRKITVN